jgi:hypothetical protein
MRLLAVLVNYGNEQLDYLQEVVTALKKFQKYEVTIIVQSNIPLDIEGVDKVNVVKLKNYQFLPLTCREEIWKRKDDFDVFIYGENDHLFLEKHVDKHIEYANILQEDRITGLIQYEESTDGLYYPGYHGHFDWDFSSVEEHGGKKFAYFRNTHQATFIITKAQLEKISKNIDFTKLIRYKPSYVLNTFLNSLRKVIKKPIQEPFRYSTKCKVNTDIYDFGGMKKMICISEIQDNLIHHLPNIYIKGLKGREMLNSDQIRMDAALKRMIEQ